MPKLRQRAASTLRFPTPAAASAAASLDADADDVQRDRPLAPESGWGLDAAPAGPAEDPPTADGPRPSATGNRGARVPRDRHHRPSGLAVVTLAGRDHYLGAFGSPESREAYDRAVAEWLARGRPRRAIEPGPALTVAALVLAYWRSAKSVNSENTSRGSIAPVLRRLRRLYGSQKVGDFGPRCLRAFQEALVLERDAYGRALSRRYINRSVGWVKRCFRWGVAEELVSPTTLQALQAVEPLRLGRTPAPETTPIGPVSDRDVAAVLPLLAPMIADMVRIQRLTGMRPGELCGMRVGELDTSQEVWLFTPRHHKTRHLGKGRSIPIGPRAQALLRLYLRPDLEAYVFSPAECARQRYEHMRAARVAPMTPSQRARDKSRARTRLRGYKDHYTTQSYALAIWRACDRSGIPRWSPNRLRHSRATELRRQFGLDTASAILGHSKVETTQIYAERCMDLAAKAALATG